MSATAMEDFYRACLGHTDPLCLKSSLSLLRVSVAPTELLFNHKHTSSSSPSSAFTQSVSITNHTRRKLRYVFVSCSVASFDDRRQVFVFLTADAYISCISLQVSCGLPSKSLHSPSLHHPVTWLHLSPPCSE